MRMGYRAAREWLILNDDTEWLLIAEKIPSVTACLIADIYGKDIETVIADLLRDHERLTAEGKI